MRGLSGGVFRLFVLSAPKATMSSGAGRHLYPVPACQRLHLGQPVSRSPQWSISTKGW